MLNYILRRMLFMIPTFIGITFLVFMLIALSPGGIGAGLQMSGGGQMQSSSGIAVQRAKMEDRYGLNESPLMQYGRWLGRICPIKFGRRSLVDPSGMLISKPREIPEPTLWRWTATSLEAGDAGLRARTEQEFAALKKSARAEARATGADAQEAEEAVSRATVAAFRAVERRYVEARAEFTTDDAILRDSVKRYVESIGRSDLIDGDLRPRVNRIEKLRPDESVKDYAEVRRLIEKAMASRTKAVNAREEIIGAMTGEPYPSAGIGIIPGVLSLAWPDLGVAFSSGQPVLTIIGRHLPVTLLLNLIAFPIIYFIAIPSGMLAATRKGSWADVGLGSLFVALYSVPVVLAGVLMVGFLATPDYFNWFPSNGLHDKDASNFTFLPFRGADGLLTRGWLMDLLWHVVLPVACIVGPQFAVLSKQTRAAMLENFSADYVRTAKAKGVPPRRIVLGHVFRNSLLPLITIFVTIFPAMLAGSVVIERIFTIQGMGYLVIEAISLRDREMLLANTAMIGVVNLAALLLADVCYAIADPRIGYK